MENATKSTKADDAEGAQEADDVISGDEKARKLNDGTITAKSRSGRVRKVVQVADDSDELDVNDNAGSDDEFTDNKKSEEKKSAAEPGKQPSKKRDKEGKPAKEPKEKKKEAKKIDPKKEEKANAKPAKPEPVKMGA